MEERFVVLDNPELVDRLNDAQARSLRRARLQEVVARGVVHEAEMPGTREELAGALREHQLRLQAVAAPLVLFVLPCQGVVVESPLVLEGARLRRLGNLLLCSPAGGERSPR